MIINGNGNTLKSYPIGGIVPSDVYEKDENTMNTCDRLFALAHIGITGRCREYKIASPIDFSINATEIAAKVTLYKRIIGALKSVIGKVHP